MNEHLKNESDSLEKLRRAEIVGELLRDSEGSVALHTSVDLSPEDRQAMLTAQSERIGNPADMLHGTSGGWGEYGERPSVAALTADEGEAVRFVTLENGDIDVRYNFKHSGYKDDTGRPGNALNIQFVVSPENATLLQRSLEADPSFINEVIEAQAKAIGVSDRHWKMKMQPRYEKNWIVEVEDKDRVLHIKTIDASNTVTGQEALVYGENKSLVATASSPLEQPFNAMTTEVTPVKGNTEQDGYLSDQEWDAQVTKSESIVKEDVEFYKSEGKTLEQIAELLKASIATDEADAHDQSRSIRDQDISAVHGLVGGEMLKKIQLQMSQEMQAASARQALEQVFNTAGFTKGQSVSVGGEKVSVADTYMDAGGNQWLELSDGRQVQASKVAIV